MAYISQDQNQQEDSSSTNVLAPTATPNPQTQQPATSSSPSVTTAPQAPTYVSNGNPYGQYGTPNSGSSASTRKSTSGPSSGLQTNVQTYAQKNQASSQKLGSSVAGKLQNTSDIAKQNLANIEKKYSQGMEAGGIANSGTALNEAKTAFQEAATATGPTRTFKSNEASLYNPTKTAEGTYSAEDQALVDANKARVTYGDGSTKEFNTAADAQSEIDSYNKSNPGYYTYGDEAQLSASNDRLSEILNAQYKGPRDLNEISGYNDTYNKIQDAAQLQNQALKSGSKEELLNRTFAAPTGEYSKGNRLLDDLLLGQGEAANTLKTTAEKLGNSPTGKITDEFIARTKQARTQATQKEGELDQIKTSARQALTETSAGRSKEVNDRIEGVIKDWDKYPTYFKERFQQQLDTHNAASQKKQQFDAISNSYAGGFSKANQDLEDNRNKIQEINNIIGNVSKEDIGYLSYASMGTDPLTGQVIPVDNNKIQSILDIANKAGLSRQVTGGSSLPLNIDTFNQMSSAEKYQLGQEINEKLAPLVDQKDISNQIISSAESVVSKASPFLEFANYDPNALNVSLSQLEAESLGVQGGEGLYNILKEQGIDGLIKTAAYDKNKLVSTDEQSQLARLQNIAQLAKDYGVEGSGVNVVNPFSNRDLAGQQTALSALDMDNFRNKLQGAERGFRTDAASSNITGTGTGSGSSGGVFGTKRASATKSLSQNFGDLLTKNNAYRNMYSDKGTNNDLLNQILQQAKGTETFSQGLNTSGIVGKGLDVYDNVQNKMNSAVDKARKEVSNFTGSELLGALTHLGPDLINKLTQGTVKLVGGSSSEAQSRADASAQQNALTNLQSNIQNKVNTSGLKNQLSVANNAQRDAELFKLLGLLDTTNL